LRKADSRVEWSKCDLSATISIFQGFILVLVALGVSLATVPLAKKIAWKCGAIDYPSKRRVHTQSIPRLGGLAIFLGIIVAFGVEIVGERAWGWQGLTRSLGQQNINYAVFLVGLAFIFGVGVVDDIKGLKVLQKLVGQIIGALIIALSGVLLTVIKNPFAVGFVDFNYWVSIPVTVIYLLLFMNAINLLDGLDGLASGVIIIAATGLLVIACLKGRIETAILACLLIGACLGFLRYNWHPATIFMGDSGALLIGALLGSLSLIGVMRTPTLAVMAVPLFVAGIAIFDGVWAAIRRRIFRQPVGKADTWHLHHVLIRNGLSQQRAVLVIYVWTVLLAAGGVFISTFSGWPAYLAIILLVAVSGIIIWRIGLIDPVFRHFFNKRGRRANAAHPDSSDKEHK